MSRYAVLDGGAVVSFREIEDYEAYPEHKRTALDEKGDGGPVLRPVVEEGAGPLTEQIIELSQVRIVRSEQPLASDDVNAERDRRLSAFTYAGKAYDFDAGSRENISGAGTLAMAAIIVGAQVGDLRWADPSVDFVWIAADNSLIPMDAQTCLEFAQAAASWKAKHIYAARALKDLPSIPADYKNDQYWP